MAQTLTADAKPASPSTGHNKPPLTQEEKNALLVHHISKLRAAQAETAKAKAPYDAAREAETALFRQAKVDGFDRKRLTALLQDSASRIRDLAREEEERFNDRIALGLPVFGVQQDLFDALDSTRVPDEAKDELAWEADGYLAGRRGGEPKPPEGCPPRMDQAFARGYDRGVEENGKLLARAGELAKARADAAKPKAPPPPEVDPTDPKEVDKAARKLKAGGFAEKSSAPAPAKAA